MRDGTNISVWRTLRAGPSFPLMATSTPGLLLKPPQIVSKSSPEGIAGRPW